LTNGILPEFPTDLPQEALEVAAVVGLADEQERSFFNRLRTQHRDISSSHLKPPKPIADIGPQFTHAQPILGGRQFWPLRRHEAKIPALDVIVRALAGHYSDHSVVLGKLPLAMETS